MRVVRVWHTVIKYSYTKKQFNCQVYQPNLIQITVKA